MGLLSWIKGALWISERKTHNRKHNRILLLFTQKNAGLVSGREKPSTFRLFNSLEYWKVFFACSWKRLLMFLPPVSIVAIELVLLWSLQRQIWFWLFHISTVFLLPPDLALEFFSNSSLLTFLPQCPQHTAVFLVWHVLLPNHYRLSL